MPLLTVNGAELYFERRGDGAPLLFIMGATGDGGLFETVADLLADEFTVVTYDRRGNGRSPRPPGWKATTAEEQADDAAALLRALGLAPAVAFGTSLGGVFALCLSIRHPGAVRGAILHEPALFSLFDDPGEVRRTIGSLVAEAMRSGGRAVAMERFVRFVAGDYNWERLESGLRERILTSAETYFGCEMGAFDAWLPDDATLARVTIPFQLLVSEGSQPMFAQAVDRLAARLGVKPKRVLGTHFPYLDHPRELVETMRPFVRRVSAGSGSTTSSAS